MLSDKLHGMGGLGKTALAANVHRKERNFSATHGFPSLKLILEKMS
jgi:hypothetical protein